jgi:succinylglutamic semialdehyde dehydrogenase
MESRRGRGDFIGGEFISPRTSDGEVFGKDPARAFKEVFRVEHSSAHVARAVDAARQAQREWAALSMEERKAALERVRLRFDANAPEIAKAIVHETGKPHREALAEAKSLGARVTLVGTEGLKRVAPLELPNNEGRERHHAQGVLVVLGPYNYPAHLVNAHVIPALITGNAVVVKPSEFCPWTGELYAQVMMEAELPPGVFNLVQGSREIGAALVKSEGTDGVLFTGSWRTGRAITEAVLDQPGKMLALEMGGKNIALVLDDCDPAQALASVLQGAFLSAGQRCTATSRVFVERRLAPRFIEALRDATMRLRPGDPWDDAAPFGPLANRPAFERFLAMRDAARGAGAMPLVPGGTLEGGAFALPSLHTIPHGVKAKGYLDEELFGPDLCVEVVEDLDHAIARMNESSYGLSNAVFTTDDAKFERVFRETKSGLLNKNRSTNGASGKLPFGGVGKSGNQRPAGIDAVRYTTYPVAIIEAAPGDVQVETQFKEAFKLGEEHFALDVDHLMLRHELEALLERYRLPVDDVAGPDVFVPLSVFRALSLDEEAVEPVDLVARLGRGALVRGHQLVLTVPSPTDEPTHAMEFFARVHDLLRALAKESADFFLGHPSRKVHLPKGGKLPRSEAYLRRLYRGDFVPREKKTPVIDLSRSEGAYLRSVDEDPLVIIDAGSQIASVGLGYQPGSFMRLLDEGELSDALLANVVHDDDERVRRYADLLTSHTWAKMEHTTFTSGGAEANEKALDLCRLNGPGGRRVIAFEGSFHGRTIAALHATWNKEKRAPFEFEGYESTFVPFPKWLDPREEPFVSDGWIDAWTRGDPPTPESDDPLESTEIASLRSVLAEIERGGVCAVVVEPMQSEGGDNYATARFMNGLRALTRGRGVPLVYDEVQTGFGLGGPFFWHRAFELRDRLGNPDGPECVTCAKRAELGVCLSVWPDPRPSDPHVAQVVRGHMHAQGLLEHNPHHLEQLVRDQLWALALDFPELVESPRNRGYAFAFDLPSAHIANQVLNQRFYRGFMAYIAGERTARFRLNTSFSDKDVSRLFEGIAAALTEIVEVAEDVDRTEKRRAMEQFKAPPWIDAGGDVEELGSRGELLDGYRSLSDDPPALLRWMLSLPRGPLERVADRVLARDGQYADERIAGVIERLFPNDNADSLPTSTILRKLRAISQEVDASSDPRKTFREWRERLGFSPARLCIEVVGARILALHPDDWATYGPGVVAIENETYEIGRRETEAELRAMVEGKGGKGLVLYRRTDKGEPRVLGYCFGGPVEQYKADGPKHDHFRGVGNTFYSSNITIASNARGSGLGLRLKQAQIEEVREIQGEDGRPRYHFITGRNRVGRTAEMTKINRAFGAYTVYHFRGNQYGDVSGEAQYYRIPLRRPDTSTALRASAREPILDWASGLQAPLGHAHPQLKAALVRGDFTGPTGTKLTLSNWATPVAVRYAELLRELCPRGLNHAFFTSGRDECIDKGIRTLRVKRPKGKLVVGLERQFLGTTSAAARSLTDPMGHHAPFAWYDWPLIPHPAEVGVDAAIGALLSVIQREGPDGVLGVVVELVGEKSGLVVPEEFLVALDEVRADTGVPIVFVENATALGRTGEELFASDESAVHPNMVLWYAGAQLGHVLTDRDTYVGKPLTLISTWDGDELSMIRTRAHLIEARALLEERRPERFEKALNEAKLKVPHVGRGLHQALVFESVGAADEVRARLKDNGLRVGAGLPGRLVLSPPVSLSDDECAKGLEILKATIGR